MTFNFQRTTLLWHLYFLLCLEPLCIQKRSQEAFSDFIWGQLRARSKERASGTFVSHHPFQKPLQPCFRVRLAIRPVLPLNMHVLDLSNRFNSLTVFFSGHAPYSPNTNKTRSWHSAGATTSLGRQLAKNSQKYAVPTPSLPSWLISGSIQNRKSSYQPSTSYCLPYASFPAMSSSTSSENANRHSRKPPFPCLQNLKHSPGTSGMYVASGGTS